MAKWPNGLPEIMGVKEVAEVLGCHTSNVSQRKQRGLPEPDAIISAGRIWRADKIRAYAASRPPERSWTVGVTGEPPRETEMAA